MSSALGFLGLEKPHFFSNACPIVVDFIVTAFFDLALYRGYCFCFLEYIGVINDGIIHDEYDIMTKSGVSFEVKTARKGRTNNTFQFNGINPRYNYDFLICLGVCEDKLLYRIFKKDEINYIHKERKYFMKQNEFKKQLVPMNPDNQVNYKLTLNIKELKEITNLIKELERVLGLD
ncbi:hypothetical protein Taitung233_12230 [Helicobacter pylori]